MTIRTALRELVRFGSDLYHMPCSSSLAKGRYGADLREEARLALLAATSDVGDPWYALSLAVYHQILPISDAAGYDHAARQCLEMLEAQDMIVRCEGADGLGRLAFDMLFKKAGAEACCESLSRAGMLLEKMLFKESSLEVLVASYALTGIGTNRVWVSKRPYELIAQLARLSQRHPDKAVRYNTSRALAAQPVAPRGDLHLNELLSDSEFNSLWADYEQLDEWSERPTVLLIAHYRRAVDDAEIIKRTQQLLKKGYIDIRIASRTLRELLGQLGVSMETEDVTDDDSDQRENQTT